MRTTSSGLTSYANIANATGQNPQTLVGDFAGAILFSNTGLTTDPRFNFQNLNPYGSYTDQFGRSGTLSGPSGYLQAAGTFVTYSPYNGAWFYVGATGLTSAGESVQITDPSGTYNINGAIGQR